MSEGVKTVSSKVISYGHQILRGEYKIKGVVIEYNRVISVYEVPGIKINVKGIPQGVKIILEVEDNVKLEDYIHLCFGALRSKGRQVILAEYRIGKNCDLRFIKHCIFPRAVNFEHFMIGRFIIGENSKVRYFEEHYHGVTGGVSVKAFLTINVLKGAYLNTTFAIRKGVVGKLEWNQKTILHDKAKGDILFKARSVREDEILVREYALLLGRESSALLRTRTVSLDKSKVQVVNILEAHGSYSRGHVDCKEVVIGQAYASTIPRLIVKNPTAQVTHEASIGRISRKELETLMARGLSEEEAIEVLIKGLLK